MTEDYNETSRKTNVLYEEEFLYSDEFCVNMMNHLSEKKSELNFVFFLFSIIWSKLAFVLLCLYFREENPRCPVNQTPIDKDKVSANLGSVYMEGGGPHGGGGPQVGEVTRFCGVTRLFI